MGESPVRLHLCKQVVARERQIADRFPVAAKIALQNAATNHAMGFLCQELQCLKFLWSNGDFLAATSNLGFEKVHHQVRKDIYACILWTEARRTPD
jgi:hypothetical protein